MQPPRRDREEFNLHCTVKRHMAKWGRPRSGTFAAIEAIGRKVKDQWNRLSCRSRQSPGAVAGNKRKITVGGEQQKQEKKDETPVRPHV